MTNLEKLFTAKDASPHPYPFSQREKGTRSSPLHVWRGVGGEDRREGKQSTSLVIKITNLVIASGFTLTLISLASLASLAVQMLDLGLFNLRSRRWGN